MYIYFQKFVAYELVNHLHYAILCFVAIFVPNRIEG